MRRVPKMAVIILLLLAPSFLRAQGNSADQEVRAVLKEMISADLKGDAGILDRTTTEDYTITRDNGVVRNKVQTLEGIKSGATKFESFSTSDVQIRVYGNVAVATFLAEIKGSRAGQDMSGRFREVRVFVKRGDNWRAVLAQRTRVAG